MKPERVQDVLRRIHPEWQLVDGSLVRVFVVDGGLGAALDFVDGIHAQTRAFERDPVVVIDGNVVTLMIGDSGGELGEVDFEIAMAIDKRTEPGADAVAATVM